MKKVFVIFSLLILTIVTGCGNNVSELNVENTKSIIEAELKDMKSIEDESLEDVYGLNLELMEVHIIKQNDNGDLYAIIKTSDKVTTKSNMSDYFEKVRKFNTNYSPERLEVLDNRLEKEIGDYLIYIVAKNADDIYKKITDSM